MDAVDFIIVVFLLFVMLGIVFETALLFYAYVNADDVECNLLWCEFKTHRQDSIITQSCFENGVMVNCSSLVMPDVVS